MVKHWLRWIPLGELLKELGAVLGKRGTRGLSVRVGEGQGAGDLRDLKAGGGSGAGRGRAGGGQGTAARS